MNVLQTPDFIDSAGWSEASIKSSIKSRVVAESKVLVGQTLK